MSVSDANQLIHNFNWYTPSWDLFIILVWAVVSLFYAFAAGRGRVIALLFSLYTTKLLVLQAPWLTNALNNQLPNTLSAIQQLVTFLIVFVFVFILLSRYAFRTAADSRRFGSIPFLIIFSFLQMGLLINTILSFLSLSGRTFSPLITLIFISSVANFVWLIAPLVFLVFLGRAVSHHSEE